MLTSYCKTLKITWLKNLINTRNLCKSRKLFCGKIFEKIQKNVFFKKNLGAILHQFAKQKQS